MVRAVAQPLTAAGTRQPVGFAAAAIVAPDDLPTAAHFIDKALSGQVLQQAMRVVNFT